MPRQPLVAAIEQSWRERGWQRFEPVQPVPCPRAQLILGSLVHRQLPREYGIRAGNRSDVACRQCAGPSVALNVSKRSGVDRGKVARDGQALLEGQPTLCIKRCRIEVELQVAIAAAG